METQADAIARARREEPGGAIHVMGAPEEPSPFTSCRLTVGDPPVVFHVNAKRLVLFEFEPGQTMPTAKETDVWRCDDCGHMNTVPD